MGGFMKSKQVFLFTLATVFATVPSFAANNERAYFQSAKEITSIVKHPAVVERLSQQGRASIDSIEHNGPHYTLSAGKCVLDVEVRYVAAPIPGGPVNREIHVGYAHCIQQ
jgi:hypothetical protein